MKVAEVNCGVAATLHVKAMDRPFDEAFHLEDEVRLIRSGDQTLLCNHTATWVIEGLSSSHQIQLNDVVLSGLPSIAYVVQARADSLVIETRRFTQELRIADTMQLGIDEKVMEDVLRGHKVGGTASDVAVWLADRLFLPPKHGEPGELQRFLITGDARGRLDAFRVHGMKVAVDVRRVNNKLLIERVNRGGAGDKSRLMLVYAPASIVDATLAAELHGSVRTTLSEAVTSSHSYLRTWQDYHNIERDHVLRRARAFGTLEYKSCERRRDQGWRFRLRSTDDWIPRLAELGEWNRFELEAGEHPPAFDEDSAKVKPTAKKPGARAQRLRANIVEINESECFIDLARPDEDDEQPQPPRSGLLYLSTSGDQARLKRRERAEEALRTGNCPLPQLGLLMEGRPAPAARRSRISVDGPKLKPVIRKVFGDTPPTQRQRKAIEIALNTPDVCLIQGPPGTGKTKVITAIEQCLAVRADEGLEPSHRILVTAAQHDAVETVAQRTEVFGLPAVKVGRRRGSDSGVDPVQVFVEDSVEQLRARVRIPPEAEQLSQARNLVLACVRTRSLPTEQAERIRALVGLLGELLPPALRDKALGRADQLTRPIDRGDPEEMETLRKAARSIRVDEGPFSDDGPLKARIALERLAKVLTEEEREFLERCVLVELESVPPWLAEGRPLRDALIDRLAEPASTVQPQLDETTQALLLEILDTVDRRRASTRSGAESVVANYLNDLDSDPDGVRLALEHYTVVLAATLQQAAGNNMRRIRGIVEGQTTFESVIVDEAARANPLDLFIPLSMARRRVVLVGDHRQLPHLLEPEVERQLTSGVDQGTVEKQILEAVKASLFERLWVLLRTLEQNDGIQRTVTLNTQYRMHPTLGRFVSHQFYERHDDGSIESLRTPAEFIHSLPSYCKGEVPCAAAWFDVAHGDGPEVAGVSKSRPVEARAIAKELKRLIDHDSKLTFGVIAFYSKQVDAIGKELLRTGLTEPSDNARGWKIAEEWSTTYDQAGKKVERLRIGTVDAFQGKEFDVVILSLTRSNILPGVTEEEQRRKFGHLMLENRLCVAMSRQKRLLVVVGDLAFVRTEDAKKAVPALNAFVELCGGEDGLIR